jgi:hypothetical protein
LRRLPTFVLVSLLVFLAAIVAGLLILALRALALWRTLRLVRETLAAAAALTTGRFAETERRLGEASALAPELARAATRLQGSTGQALALLRAATATFALLGHARALLPSK